MQNINLTDHFLIAMPALEDPYFSRALIYIAEHNEQGALGLIVNRPIEINLATLLEKIAVPLEPEDSARLGSQPVLFGGPVQTDRGFVLHRPIGKWQFALVIALGLLLGLQILIADRERLAADEDWRPLITRLCDALGCSVPTWHQPGAFSMLNRDVRPVADLPGALEAQATFRNDAAWPQAWPLLLLSLSDADGRVVGTRQFTPAEYLGKDIPKAGLAPGQSAQVSFRLREPDAGVVAFSFDFR